jgi:hypothetical protein
MAERTLAEVATAGRPAQDGVIANNEEAYAKFVDVRGPYKAEVSYYQQAAANDFAADDTFVTTLSHPLFVTAQLASDGNNDAGNEFNLSASVDSDESNSTFRTVTLHDAEDTNGLGVLITVYGF